MSASADRGCERWAWRDCANAWGSDMAAVFRSCRALRSRLLFSRCSWSSDMAERSAIASGFSLSDMGSDGGCWRNAATGGGRTCFSDAEGSGRGASFAGAVVGVRGDTGGRPGEREWERSVSRSSEGASVSVGEAERVLVGEGMVNAGMVQRATDDV